MRFVIGDEPRAMVGWSSTSDPRRAARPGGRRINRRPGCRPLRRLQAIPIIAPVGCVAGAFDILAKLAASSSVALSSTGSAGSSSTVSNVMDNCDIPNCLLCQLKIAQILKRQYLYDILN
jgi:hypothetical protein